MPRNTRDWSKREIDRAINNLDWSGKHLNAMEETYREQHPEIANQLMDAMNAIAAIMRYLKELKAIY